MGSRWLPARISGDVAGRNRCSDPPPCCSATWPVWMSKSVSGATPSTASFCCAAATKPRPRVMGAAVWIFQPWWCRVGRCLNGKFRGTDIGSGTNVWSFSEEVRTGTMSLSDVQEAESCMSRSAGHCMTMGTASTMACMVEALGLALPDNAAIPAVDSRRISAGPHGGPSDCRAGEGRLAPFAHSDPGGL